MSVHFALLILDPIPLSFVADRCLQTARPTSVALGLPIFAEHGLSEWYSPVTPKTGLHPRPGPAAELTKHISAVDVSWRSLYIPPRVGETVPQVHQRCTDFLEALISQLESTTDHKHIVLITHAATAIALARSLLQQPNLPLRVGCCTVTTIERDPSVSYGKPLAGWKYQPDHLASGDHLKGGIQRDWGFEDIEIANGDVITDEGIPGSEHEKDSASGIQIDFQKEDNVSRL